MRDVANTSIPNVDEGIVRGVDRTVCCSWYPAGTSTRYQEQEPDKNQDQNYLAWPTLIR